jgi:hypothetical protein
MNMTECYKNPQCAKLMECKVDREDETCET